jgi:hypothetical protein
MAVVDATCAHPAAVGHIQLQLLLDLLALEGIPNPQGDPGQLDFLHPVAGTHQQPDLVLAERQHEEVPVTGEQREQRGDMEAVIYHRQLRKA